MNQYTKVPDAANNWQAMDIFIFSNGQQNSPPRKYHLRSDELNCWSATLDYLARLQYGPIHSTIELYTTHGQKIEGPLQLKNGAAYVAVELPNTFIDTGYDKYLIKASRSLEKRQAKRPNSYETLLPDENANKSEHILAEIIINDNNDGNQKYQAVVGSTAVNSSEHQDETYKPPALDNQRLYPKNNLTAAKNNDKRRPSQPAAFRRISTLNPIEIPPDTKKTYIKRNTSPVKRKLKIPVKTNERPSVENNWSSKIASKSMSKTMYNNVKQALPNPIVDPLKLEKEASEMKDLSQSTINTVFTSNQQTQVTNYNQVPNLMNSNVSSLYRNPVADMASTVIVEEDNLAKIESFTQELTKTNEESELSQIMNRNYAKQSLDNLTLKNKTVTKSSSKIKFTNVPSIQAYNVSDTDKLHDNYCTVINKGDIINFQLKIEVRNAEGSVSTAQNTPKPISTINYMKSDKSSQVHIDTDLLQPCKSLHSTLAGEQAVLVNSDGNSKIVVVHCGCRETYPNNIQRDPTEFKDSMRYILVLPPPRCRDYNERCKCNDDLPIEKEIKKTFYTERPSIINSIKKTYSDISLERLCSLPKKEPENDTTTEDTNMAVGNPTDLAETNEDQYSKKECITNRHVAIDEQQANAPLKIISQNPSETIDVTKKTEYAVIKNKTVPTNLVDKSTQTDWCNLLLEARCHEDGRYTFHLPQLHVLKNYTL